MPEKYLLHKSEYPDACNHNITDKPQKLMVISHHNMLIISIIHVPKYYNSV